MGLPSLTTDRNIPAIPVRCLAAAELDTWRAQASAAHVRWVEQADFKAARRQTLLLPADDGSISAVLFGLGEVNSPQPDTGEVNSLHTEVWDMTALASSLPPGTYVLDQPADAMADAKADTRAGTLAALGWALSGYRFSDYRDKAADKLPPVLQLADGLDEAEIARQAKAVFLTRNLINLPAADLGPAELADAAASLAAQYGAQFRVIVGDALRDENYPTIYTVGQAAGEDPHRAPRLIDFVWGQSDAPKVTLVGKGVCFDSGGLDLKPSAAMLLMKKDMGGAANVLGLARMIMDAELPVRLRVLIPAVENSVSSTAFRPGDILKTRKGLTVEVGNTDAEGRLVLCDALAEADSESPDLLIDFATLTGAARVALGPEIPAMFSNNDSLAQDLTYHGQVEADPMWRLPLWQPYDRMLDSKIANLNNVSSGPFAGAITAALYLQRFVSQSTPWAHIDLYGWNPTAQPGRPVGGEAQCIRAVYAAIRQRYGDK